MKRKLRALTGCTALFACTLAFNPLANAQVSAYTFTQSAGTYTAATGGTVLANANNLNMDDEVFGPIAIPTFTFDGVPQHFIYVSTNGFITFGAPPFTTDYDAVSGTNTYSGAIAAFSTDLDMAASGTRNIRCVQVGSEFVIQWQNVMRYPATGERLSFQIRLNSTNNQIKVVYGGTITVDNTVTDYPEVGLRGPDNTFGVNVNNRKVTTGAWTGSVAGTANTSTCTYATGTVPAAGTTFTWSAPAVDMSALTLASPGTSGCYGSNETVAVRIRNSGGASINFSTTPVTVNCNVTGPNAMSFPPVVVNSGTLAVNATQVVNIATGYNMQAAGTYTFNANTSATGDPLTSNDAMPAVTRDSHMPSVTAPSSAVVCMGSSTTLATTAVTFPFVQASSNTTALPVPDDTPAGVNSTITITGASAVAASDVIVRIDSLAHTYDGDLIFTLYAPDGSSMILSNQEGLDGAGYYGTVFTNTASNPIYNGTAPFTGDFLPEDPFTNLTGSANGTWTLNVSDNAAADVGTLKGWTLIFTIPNSVVSYSWTPSASLNSSTISAPDASPTSTTTYTVMITDESGCTSSDSVTVSVNPLPVVVANASASLVCAGTNVTFTGSGATSYSWSGGVTDGVPFPVTATGTFVVTGTDGNGCTNTDNAVVTVNPLPNVTANASVPAVCPGGSVTLTGGGAVSYTWSGSVSDGLAFVPATTDTYTVTGIDGNGCSNTANTTVTVNPLPNVIANASSPSVCEGGSLTLSGSGAVSYSWSGSVSDGVTFVPTTTSTYTVTGTDANGCVNTDNTTVTVNPLPTVTASSSAAAVCAGNSVTLNGNGASSYSWTNSVTDGVAFVPAATTTYTVTGTDGNGCSKTDSIAVTVNPLPTVTVNFLMDTVCYNGGTVLLNGESPAGGTWSGNGVSGSSFDPQAAGFGITQISYVYTDVNGCSSTDTEPMYVDACNQVAINNAGSMQINIYPNPNNGVFALNISNSEVNELSLQILDLQGQLIYSETLTGISSNYTKQLDLSAYANGAYFLKVYSGSTVYMAKVMKQN